MPWGWFALALVSALWTSSCQAQQGDVYLVGAGIADVTGPSAGVNMMGYALFSQTTNGIHLRLYSRAYIIGDQNNRAVFVTVDVGMISQAVREAVLAKLAERGFGDLYTTDNVAISGTHTHSGPAGFFEYFLYLITSLGFIKQTYDAMVTGIATSIERAHNNLQQGRILVSSGELLDASINRSPTSYLFNSEDERARYAYDVDKTMLMLKFVDLNGNPIHMLNWFSVHGTSMNNTNGLLSSDNKGCASVLFEADHNPAGTLIGKGTFVGAFAQSNEGDVSPNTQGAKCRNSGLPCDPYTSTCGGRSEECIAFGPGRDMFESTKMICEKQYEKAKELYGTASEGLHGPVQTIHQFMDMTDQTVVHDGVEKHTCVPALGHSFAAGTTDGPGAFDFKQGTTFGTQNPLWDMVRNVLFTPNATEMECHSPKPILLNVGDALFPYQWTPTIVPTQILRVGNLFIVAVPGEFTTMSGRRVREAVGKAVNGTVPDARVVIAGLTNEYSNYITTFEEYQAQRYEGASTLFGPHTLEAYIQQFVQLADNLVRNQTVPSGPIPENIIDEQISLVAEEPMFDSVPPGRRFGDVVKEAQPAYYTGDTVKVTYICGNPRNNLQLEGSYLTVERQNSSSQEWSVIATDANWETRFRWTSTNSFLQQSQCTVEWAIPEGTPVGQYRISHTGHFRRLFSGVSPYTSYSRVFTVQQSAVHYKKNKSVLLRLLNKMPKRNRKLTKGV